VRGVTRLLTVPLRRARAAGLVRDDLTLADVIDVLAMVSAVVTGDAEIADHLLGTSEGAFGIHDPLDAVEPVPRTVPSFRIGRSALLGQRELTTRVGGVERGEELSAEQRAHDLHREEEIGRRVDPSGAIEGQPAAGDDGVHMRMERTVRPTVRRGSRRSWRRTPTS
jgi:hypothetical protein